MQNGMANSVDTDQSMIWVYTVCSDLSVQKFRNITVRLKKQAYNSEHMQTILLSQQTTPPSLQTFNLLQWDLI